MAFTVEEVDRPEIVSHGSSLDPEFVQAFLNTLHTGKAIKVRPEEIGVPYRTLLTRLQTVAMTHKVKQRTRKQGDFVVVWVEPLPESVDATASTESDPGAA